jgi:hypothetical protein
MKRGSIDSSDLIDFFQGDNSACMRERERKLKKNKAKYKLQNTSFFKQVNYLLWSLAVSRCAVRSLTHSVLSASDSASSTSVRSLFPEDALNLISKTHDLLCFEKGTSTIVAPFRKKVLRGTSP